MLYLTIGQACCDCFTNNESKPKHSIRQHSFCFILFNLLLQEMIKEASRHLLNATKKHLYFKEVAILVPPNWNKGNYSKAKTEVYNKVLRESKTCK